MCYVFWVFFNEFYFSSSYYVHSLNISFCHKSVITFGFHQGHRIFSHNYLIIRALWLICFQNITVQSDIGFQRRDTKFPAYKITSVTLEFYIKLAHCMQTRSCFSLKPTEFHNMWITTWKNNCHTLMFQH